MTLSRFLRLLTSNKALILRLLSLMSFVVLSYTAYRIYQQIFQERSVSGVVNIENNSNVHSKMSLGGFQPLNGTPFLMAAISSQQNYQQSYYDKEALGIRNFLFFNSQDKSARKLVPKNEFLFLRSENLGKQTPQGNIITNVRGIWYELVTADSNGDKRLTREDDKTIAVSDVSGASYTEIIRQVDRVLATHQPNETTFLIFYTSGRKNFVTEININTRTVLVTQELPLLE